MRGARVTGFQVAQQTISAQLEGWRKLFPPLEYEDLLDVLTRMLEHERRREARRRGNAT